MASDTKENWHQSGVMLKKQAIRDVITFDASGQQSALTASTEAVHASRRCIVLR